MDSSDFVISQPPIAIEITCGALCHLTSNGALDHLSGRARPVG